jgi:hypothetical protein
MKKEKSWRQHQRILEETEEYPDLKGRKGRKTINTRMHPSRATPGTERLPKVEGRRTVGQESEEPGEGRRGQKIREGNGAKEALVAERTRRGIGNARRMKRRRRGEEIGKSQ